MNLSHHLNIETIGLLEIYHPTFIRIEKTLIYWAVWHVDSGSAYDVKETNLKTLEIFGNQINWKFVIGNDYCCWRLCSRRAWQNLRVCRTLVTSKKRQSWFVNLLWRLSSSSKWTRSTVHGCAWQVQGYVYFLQVITHTKLILYFYINLLSFSVIESGTTAVKSKLQCWHCLLEAIMRLATTCKSLLTVDG